MADRCYLMNRTQRVVLFLGEFGGSPRFDKVDIVNVEKWSEVFGPVESFRVTPSAASQYGVPWGLGNGKMNPTWQSWVLLSPRSALRASKQWKGWPQPDLATLAAATAQRR